MNLNFPLGLLGLLGVPVIILLYLLKQKHEDYTVSSLYLWQNALQDVEANAPWQRLKKNILMLLQILAVILLAFILSEPMLKSDVDQHGAIILVMDCSLSMQSADMKPSRFEAAKADAMELVQSSESGTSFSLIASDHTPYVILHKVTDKNKVLQELEDLTVNDTAEDREGTVELVNSLLRDHPDATVSWFSDGRNPASDPNIRYYSYNRNGDNYAVTLLTQRKLQSGQGMTALSRVANFSHQDAELDVSLYTDGRVFDARRVAVKAGESESLYWTELPVDVLKLECRIDTPDVLEKDNSAGLMVYSEQVGKVLLATEKNLFLEKVLGLIPGIELYRTNLTDVEELTGYDLYLFDGELPEQLPEDGHIMVFNPPEHEYFVSEGFSEYTGVRSTDHNLFSDLKQSLTFSAMKTNLFKLPEWGNPILENDEGIIAFEGFPDKRHMMVFGFDLHETNLPVQPFFPVIITRAVQELIPGDSGAVSSVNAGDSVKVSVDPEANEVFIISPDGEQTAIAPPFPMTGYNETLYTGIYTLNQKLGSGTIEQSFFVNAPSEKEFAASEQSALEAQNEAGERVGGKPTGWSLKMPLLWLLLAILLIEWWVYANGIAI